MSNCFDLSVGKERKKRQLAEERIEALERASRQLVQHYDSRFICLAKEVRLQSNVYHDYSSYLAIGEILDNGCTDWMYLNVMTAVVFVSMVARGCLELEGGSGSPQHGN